MINVTNDFKIRTKKIKQQNVKLTIIGEEKTVKEINFMPTKQFNLLPVWLLKKRKEVIAKQLIYSFEGNLFKTIMKQIEITVKNAIELKDKNVRFQYGLYVNDNFEYVDLGTYYIKDLEDNKKKTEITVTGYDKMINFMKLFNQSELKITYPCKMKVLLQRMCEVCDTEMYSTDFFNSDLDIYEDFFTAQELTYRDVLEKIAATTLTTIFIKNDKLYLCKLKNEIVETIDKTYITDLVVKEKFGPVNALVLGRGQVEDNIESKDDISISENGRCEIRFDENEFIEFQREQVIDEMFEQIKGLEYYSFEASDLGIIWLEPCDFIKLIDSEENEYKTIYLSANIKITTGITSDTEADIPEETTTKYKVTSKEEKKTLKVERLAKKNEGLIQDLIKETTENSEKMSEVEQTVDSINQKVESKIDVTQTTSGISEITLENCMNGDLLKLVIYGNNTVFENDSFIEVNKENLINENTENVTANIDKIDFHYNTGLANCKSLILTVNKNQEYTVRKKSGKRFALATFSAKPLEGNIANKYISDENEGENLTELSITTGENDNYLVIFYYDGSIDTITENEMYESIIVQSNYQKINLGITEVLRQLEDVRDQFVLENGKSKIIRKIGVNEEGKAYVLDKEKIENLNNIQITLNQGNNTISIDYIATIEAKYVIVNNFTNMFTSTVEFKTAITQMADSISLDLSKKTNNEDIIARFNMAILGIDDTDIPEYIEKSIIQIFADILEIDTSNFKLTKEGIATILKGIIGGLTIEGNTLYKRYINNNTEYESGLFIPETTNGNTAFLYAGKLVSSNNLYSANVFLMHNGNLNFRAGSLNMIYEPTLEDDGSATWKKALEFLADGLNRYLPNGNRWTYEGIGYVDGVANSHSIFLYDATQFCLINGAGGNVYIFRIERDSKKAYFYGKVYCNQNYPLIRSVSTNGQEIEQMRLLVSYIEFTVPGFGAYAINGITQSDEKLKKNITETKVSGLEVINKIKHIEFDWNDTKQSLRKGHEEISYSANQIKEDIGKEIAFEVKQPEGCEYDTLLQINSDRLLPYVTKSIQELNKKIEQLKKIIDDKEKIIDFLIKKLNCEKEIENLKKGGM